MSSRAVLLFGFAAALGLACSDAEQPEVEGDSDRIIGGTAARGVLLDAIGALRYSAKADAGMVDAGAVPSGFTALCTATLIAPTLIVTAKHCAASASDVTAPISDRQTLFFTLGADAIAPRRTIRVVRSLLSSVHEGGYVGYGSDVAVMQLEESVDDVVPLKVADAHLGAALEGSKLTAVGFGYRDRAKKMGTRRAGTLTLRATSGQFMARVFGSQEELSAFAHAESPQGFGLEDEERLVSLWERTLLPSYEIFLGLAYGDAQPCSGDSGGPLLALVGTDLVVAGVVSGSHKLTNRSVNPCSVLGQTYATFGPSVQTTFSAAERSVGQRITRVPVTAVAAGSAARLPTEIIAPTGDAGTLAARCHGLTKSGICTEGTVQRCIDDSEGPPRPVQIDCTLLRSTCAVNPATQAAECVDAPVLVNP